MLLKISFSVCRRQQVKRSCWSIDPRFFACGALEKESTGRCCSLCFVINDTEGKSTTPATETAAWHLQLADEHRQKFSPAATNLHAMYLFSGMSGATKVTTLYSNLASGRRFYSAPSCHWRLEVVWQKTITGRYYMSEYQHADLDALCNSVLEIK